MTFDKAADRLAALGGPNAVGWYKLARAERALQRALKSSTPSMSGTVSPPAEDNRGKKS